MKKQVIFVDDQPNVLAGLNRLLHFSQFSAKGLRGYWRRRLIRAHGVEQDRVPVEHHVARQQHALLKRLQPRH